MFSRCTDSKPRMKGTRRTVEVLVDGVETDEEVAEDVLLLGRDVREERADDRLAARELASDLDN